MYKQKKKQIRYEYADAASRMRDMDILLFFFYQFSQLYSNDIIKLRISYIFSDVDVDAKGFHSSKPQHHKKKNRSHYY